MLDWTWKSLKLFGIQVICKLFYDTKWQWGWKQLKQHETTSCEFRFEQALGIQGQRILFSHVALPSEMEQCGKTSNKPTIWGWFI